MLPLEFDRGVNKAAVSWLVQAPVAEKVAISIQIMQASKKTYELDLVLPIYKLMRICDVKPTGATGSMLLWR